MNFKKLQNFLLSPWIITLFILVVFLSTTGYKFGWDDQHLEVTLLKHLIDNSLYSGDYYVESLKHNFTSFLYPILSKLITIEQIPTTYFILFILARYFMFFWIYKLWLLISNDKLKATYCTLVFILLARVPEFLYRTFSHQEFALAIIFAGIYYFFKERFYLSALLLGIAANFHALYSLFPILFMLSYLLVDVKKHGFKKIFLSGTIFATACMPFLIWTIKIHFAKAGLPPVSFAGWEHLYKLACPQNFMLPYNVPLKFIFHDLNTALVVLNQYISVILLFLINIFFNKDFRQNKKAVVFCLTAFFLLLVSLVFTYFYPVRFVLDLNLIRNIQFITFLIMGFTTLLAFKIIEEESNLYAYVFSILFICLKYGYYVMIYSLLGMVAFFLFIHGRGCKRALKNIFWTLSLILTIISAYGIYHYLGEMQYKFDTRLFFLLIAAFLTVNFFAFYFIREEKHKRTHKIAYLVIPLCLFILQYNIYRVERSNLERTDEGFWRVQNSWEDMQRFAKENTPKDAIFLVPHNMVMGGFRLFSERKVVASYRDCGIVGFDYRAALEWKKRIDDIGNFSIQPTKPFGKAIKNAILKYGADYIVFLRFAQPVQNPMFEKIYTNKDFVLYKVIK